jgi:hypothetical protein
MGLIVKEGSNIVPVEEGVHHAICYALYDLGTQFSEKWGKSAHQCIIIWELPEERIEITKDGETMNLPRVTSKKYTMSLNEKASLRKDLQSWRGKNFTSEELSGFDIEKLLGVNCMIQIIHTKKDASVYANIASITPLFKGMVKREPENPTVIYHIGEPIPPSTPKWIKELIEGSAEWRTGDDGDVPADMVDGSDIPF